MSALVLILSDGTPIDRWRVGSNKVQPQVLLSIFSTIMNALLGFALVEGLVILFWRRAGRGTMVGVGSIMSII